MSSVRYSITTPTALYSWQRACTSAIFYCYMNDILQPRKAENTKADVSRSPVQALGGLLRLLLGRLYQWALWARAHGHRIFFLFEGPPTGCGELNFLKLIILLPSQRSTVRETRQILSSEGPRSAGGGGAQGLNVGKDATGLLSSL